MDYAGITIDWIRGKKAVMTIYNDDGTQQGEPIQLYELQTREQMHQVMVDKGFHKKTRQQEIQEIQSEVREKQLQRLGDGTSSLSSSMFRQQMTMYYFVMVVVVMMIIILVGVIGGLVRFRKRKRMRNGGNHHPLVSRV
jgi:cytochrome bd-type quinol oxidase subunit 1